MKIVCFFSLICFPFLLCAQSIILTDGNKTETLSKNNFCQFNIGAVQSIRNCSDCTVLSGHINQVDKDSIVVTLKSITKNVTNQDKFKIASTLNFNNDLTSNTWKFAKSEVYYMEVFKSEAQVKKRRNRLGLGGILISSGLLTAASTLLVDGSDNRRNLLIAAGAQEVLGIVLVSSIRKKRYKFFGEGNWQFQ